MNRYELDPSKGVHISTLHVMAILSSVACLLSWGSGHAQDALPKRSYLPLPLAQKAAQAAMAQCTKDGYAVSVAVVDASGVPTVLLRADGAGPHTVSSSTGKAFTAASLRRGTLEFAEFIKNKPELAGLRDMDDRILILGGGLPITIGGEVVGGIGVGGAPGAQLDEKCAQVGIESLTQ